MEKKKKFEKPKMETIQVNTSGLIATSGCCSVGICVTDNG